MNIASELYIFSIFIITGILIGILFDIFRILRKSFKTTDFITYIEDILFWILSGFVLIYSIFTFNNGEIRSYVFIGLGLGIIFYISLFSKLFIKINVIIISFLKKIFSSIITIIIFPIKLLLKVLKKPISFIFINFRKTMKDIFIKMSKIKINVRINLKKQKKSAN